MSLYGVPETPLCEAVKVKPELLWRPPNIGDAGTMGYLLNRTDNRKWNQPKREKCVAVNRAEKSGRSEEHFDTRHGDAEFGVCPACFWSCFGPGFSHLCSFSYILKL